MTPKTPLEPRLSGQDKTPKRVWRKNTFLQPAALWGFHWFPAPDLGFGTTIMCIYIYIYVYIQRRREQTAVPFLSFLFIFFHLFSSSKRQEGKQRSKSTAIFGHHRLGNRWILKVDCWRLEKMHKDYISKMLIFACTELHIKSDHAFGQIVLFGYPNLRAFTPFIQ